LEPVRKTVNLDDAFLTTRPWRSRLHGPRVTRQSWVATNLRCSRLS